MEVRRRTAEMLSDLYPQPDVRGVFREVLAAAGVVAAVMGLAQWWGSYWG